MKRYIKLAMHYADYRKFCDMLERLCLQNEALIRDELDYGFEQELLEYEIVYMLYDKPILAHIALDFKLDQFMLRKYPHSEGIAETLHNVAYDPQQFYLDHIYGRN